MKRWIIFLLALTAFACLYNLTVLQSSFLGFLGNISYENKDFPHAQKQYSDVLKSSSGSVALESTLLYNLGNALYRLGEKEKRDERIKLYRESVESFTRSLTLRADKDTEENLAFVKERVEREEQAKKEEEFKQEKRENNTGSWNTNDTSSWTASPTGTTGGNGANATSTGTEQKSNTSPSWRGWSNGGSYAPIGWPEENNTNMNDTERQEVQKYLEDLKQFARKNGKLLNSEKLGWAGDLSEQIRNFFWSDSFFQDIIPSNDGKKDW